MHEDNFRRLDAMAIPAAAVRGGSDRMGVTADPVDAENSARKPANGAQERKRNIRLPLRARVGTIKRDAAPVKGISATPVQPIDQQPKAHKPHDTDEEVGRPVDERPAEGEQPDDGKQNRDAGNDLGVDEPPQAPRRRALRGMQELARERRDNDAEGELRQTEDHGEEIGEKHDGGGWLLR